MNDPYDFKRGKKLSQTILGIELRRNSFTFLRMRSFNHFTSVSLLSISFALFDNHLILFNIFAFNVSILWMNFQIEFEILFIHQFLEIILEREKLVMKQWVNNKNWTIISHKAMILILKWLVFNCYRCSNRACGDGQSFLHHRFDDDVMFSPFTYFFSFINSGFYYCFWYEYEILVLVHSSSYWLVWNGNAWPNECTRIDECNVCSCVYSNGWGILLPNTPPLPMWAFDRYEWKKSNILRYDWFFDFINNLDPLYLFRSE